MLAESPLGNPFCQLQLAGFEEVPIYSPLSTPETPSPGICREIPMEPIRNLEELKQRARELPSRTVAVVRADEVETITAVAHAVEEEMVDAILIGDSGDIAKAAVEAGVNIKGMEIVEAVDDTDAAFKGVGLIREGRAHLLVKGLVSSSTYLKAVLDKERGIRGKGLLSHVAAFDIPTYPKLLLVTDAAMNIAPDFDQKVEMLRNAIAVANALGIDRPKATYVCAKEVPYAKMPCTLEAAKMNEMAQRGEIGNVEFDGPLAMDLAVSPEAKKIKKVDSEVAGQTDIILTPDIEAGNILYKTLLFLSRAEGAAVIMGATHPVVLTSRADSAESKLCSIVLSALVATHQQR